MPLGLLLGVKPMIPVDTYTPKRKADSMASLVGDFCFGGLHLRMSTQVPSMFSALCHRYPRRSHDKIAQDPLGLSYVVTGHQPLDPKDLFNGRKTPVALCRRGLDWQLEGRDFQASFSAEKRHLQITGPEALYPLDLACLALWYLCHPNGLILHGAGLVFDDTGWICSGPSGVGKTTMTQLFPEQALCDEFCGVVVGDHVDLVSLPFWASKPATLPLTGIYLLEHATEDACWPLSRETAWRRLASQVFWPYFDEQASQQTFNNLTKLVHQVPVSGLGFRPTKKIARMFNAAKGSNA